MANYTITVSWNDGDDLDICGYFSNNPSNQVGWGHSNTISADGYSAVWGGDNTAGGPETITVTTPDPADPNVKFCLHANWYSTGSGHSGGTATVTISGDGIQTASYELSPSHNADTRATKDDPMAEITFGQDGPSVEAKYTVAVAADPPAFGSVTGGGRYADGAQCTIEATPNSGYRFVRWVSDSGETQTTRTHTFQVDGNSRWTAEFASSTCMVTLVVGSTGHSTVDLCAFGGQHHPSPVWSASTWTGAFEYGEQCTVKSSLGSPANGYKFNKWVSDGTPYPDLVGVNEHTFTVVGDVTWTVYYEKDGTLTVTNTTPSSSAAHGSLTLYGRGMSSRTSIAGFSNSNYGICRLVATPVQGYALKLFKFTEYVSSNLTQTYNVPAWAGARPTNPYDFPVYRNTEVTAVFDRAYTVSVASDPAEGGDLEIDGEGVSSAMVCNTVNCTITAIPRSGYSFVKWTSPGKQDVTSREHTFEVTGSIVWTAHFKRDNTYRLLHGSSDTLLHGSSGALLHDA